MDWQAILIDPIQTSLRNILGFLPNLLGALLILLVGLALAKGLEQIVARLLKMVRLDRLAQETKLDDVLRKGGIRDSLSELIGSLVYWLGILLVVMSALNALNLTVAADLLARVVAYLPNVIAAVFILVLGIFASVFVGTTVRTTAKSVGLKAAGMVSQITQVVIIIFASVAALEQLGIQFVGDVFKIILLGISLGFALAYGLGCQAIARESLEGLLQDIRKK
jgi:hypothetical protein